VGLNLRDPAIFQQKPTSDLLLAYGILKACSFEPVVKLGPQLLEALEKFSLEGTSHAEIDPFRFCFFSSFFVRSFKRHAHRSLPARYAPSLHIRMNCILILASIWMGQDRHIGS
jgi:hypothetical protein